MMECMKSMAKKPKGERIKVSDLEIIVTIVFWLQLFVL